MVFNCSQCLPVVFCDSQWFVVVLNRSQSLPCRDSQWLATSGSEWFSEVTSISQCLPVVFNSTMVLSGSAWFLITAGGSQWFPVVLSWYQCFSMITSGSQWFLVVLSGSHWLPVVLNGLLFPQHIEWWGLRPVGGSALLSSAVSWLQQHSHHAS